MSAKRGRQLVDYSVQREKILPCTAMSRFADADIKVYAKKKMQRKPGSSK